MQPRGDHSWVQAFVLAELRFAERPIKRDELAERVMLQASAGGHWGWKRATAARRTREAIAALIDDGWPISSNGRGFVLDDSETARRAAERKLERTIESLQVRLSRLRSAPQRMLPLEGDGVGATW